MTDITPLVPRQPVPPLAVPLVLGGRFDIATEKSERFTFILFYRGLHCPICRTQMGDLEAKLPEFAKRGTNVGGGVVRERRACQAGMEACEPAGGIWPRSAGRPRVGSLRFDQPRHDLDRRRGAAVVFRAGR